MIYDTNTDEIIPTEVGEFCPNCVENKVTQKDVPVPHGSEPDQSLEIYNVLICESCQIVWTILSKESDSVEL